MSFRLLLGNPAPEGPNAHQLAGYGRRARRLRVKAWKTINTTLWYILSVRQAKSSFNKGQDLNGAHPSLWRPPVPPNWGMPDYLQHASKLADRDFALDTVLWVGLPNPPSGWAWNGI